MSENNKEQDFVDRVSTHRNRRKLTIISQSPNEMIVDVERADSATINGSIISADTLNDFQDEIDTANSYASSALSTANSANTTAQTASTAANSANQTATSADTKATTALSNSQTAVTTANEAKAKALEVESKLADRGATIKINGASQTEINFTSDPQTQISNEVTARTNADNNLQTQITNEATTRQNIDSSLQPAFFLNILLFLTIAGAVSNNRLFEPGRDKYYSIILMRMNAAKYTITNYLYELLKIIIGFLGFLISVILFAIE